MSNDIRHVLLNLIKTEKFQFHCAAALEGSRDSLAALAMALHGEQDFDDAQRLCDRVLAEDPNHVGAQRVVIKLEAAKGNVEGAIQRLIGIRSIGLPPAELVEDIRAQLPGASAVITNYVAAGQVELALNLVELLVTLCPGVELFTENALRLSLILDRPEKIAKYQAVLAKMRPQQLPALDAAARAANAQRNFEEEVRLRLAIFRSPEDIQRNSALRLDNIHSAISALFDTDWTSEKRPVYDELVAAIPSIPPLEFTGGEGDYMARFDRFWRMIIERLRIDIIFGPPLQPVSWPQLQFVAQDGRDFSMPDLSDLVKKNNIEVAFIAPTSEGYFARHARAYVSSILKACDCNCLVFVCVSGKKERLGKYIAQLGLSDPRIVFCSDDFDPEPGTYKLYNNTDQEPSSIIGPYYASVALLGLPQLLPHLSIPIFLSGIDTVLQRGVRDLIERFHGADVILNKNETSFVMESYFTNSLQLFYPTEGALVYANFLNNYLGGVLRQTVQPVFYDQMSLLMARHHLQANRPSARIENFGEFDTNNIMFRKFNYAAHRDLISKYRFVNIFSGGEENAIKPEDIYSET